MAPPQPITKARKQHFLAVYRASGGSFSAAAKAASPLSRDKSAHPGYNAWRKRYLNDEEFGAEVDQVKELVKQDLEDEIWRRGVTGVSEAVFQGGKRMQDESGKPVSILKFSDKLLLARMKKVDPEYRDNKTVTIQSDTIVGVGAVLSPNEIRRLSDEDRQKLSAALELISDLKDRGSSSAPPVARLSASQPKAAALIEEKVAIPVALNAASLEGADTLAQLEAMVDD